MKYTTLLALIVVSLSACHKKPEEPAQVAVSTTQPQPPPVTNCQGATVPWSLPSGQTINDLSSKDFTIAGFDVGCGDTLRVYMRRPNIFPADPWTEYFNVDNGASYYALNGQIVTVYNKTGIVLEVAIETVLF